jgi:hypothetical protein
MKMHQTQGFLALLPHEPSAAAAADPHFANLEF